ncbi:MAG TPA: response regulator transcription factor [Bacteroidia bacterium]|nr:response regulator transcription factor [Bacteroidia bacterium]
MRHTAIVADDHAVFRKGIVEILGEMRDLEIVAELPDGLQAYQSIIEKRPDLAILDIEMPGLSGLEICRKVMSGKSETKFVVLTMHKDKNFFHEAMSIGVTGYLFKDHARSDLVRCVENVLKGKRFVSPGLENLAGATAGHAVPELAHLTPTEKVILKLIAESKTSAEIAQLLFVSPDAIDNHRSDIVKKLKLEDKNSLRQFAIPHKYLL